MSLWLLFVTITITKQCDGGLAVVFLAQGIFLHNLLKNAVGQLAFSAKPEIRLELEFELHSFSKLD